MTNQTATRLPQQLLHTCLHCILALLTLIIFFHLLSSFAIATENVTCFFNDTCANTPVLYVDNDTTGYYNAHGENISLASYPFVLCCNTTSTESTISNDCAMGSAYLKLHNETNAHVQVGNYTGPNSTYTVDTCIGTNPGDIQCLYEPTSCRENYTCVVSMASSEDWAANQTNAHVGPCTAYDFKVCCELFGFNVPPEITNVILNATSELNRTLDNLTLTFSTADNDSNAVYNITDWRIDGTSLALQNMPFELNVSKTDSGAVHDHSTYGRNGTLGAGTASQAPIWEDVDCAYGGCYAFDGIDDLIRSSGFSELGVSDTQYTFTAWVNAAGGETDGNVIHMSSLEAGGGWCLAPLALESGKARGYSWTGSANSVTSNSSIDPGVWYHLANTWDPVNGLTIYVNGSLENTDPQASYSASGLTNFIHLGYSPATCSGDKGHFNGSIDGVRIYARSLSPEHIHNLYEAGYNNHSLNDLASNETAEGQNWTVAVTGSDFLNESATILSNELHIIPNQPPSVPVLIEPTVDNVTTNRTPTFKWADSTDPEDDFITYTLNISCYSTAGGSCTAPGDDRLFNLTTNITTLADELKFFVDDGFYYNWTVQAFDWQNESGWAMPRTINLTVLVALSLTTDNVDFGTLGLGETDNTEDDNPPPFVIRNDGNAVIEVNITELGISLWNSTATPNDLYQYKTDNVTGEEGSFNGTRSAITYTNMPKDNLTVLAGFNHSDLQDSAEVEINVTVPLDEPPGQKTSTVVYTGYYIGGDS